MKKKVTRFRPIETFLIILTVVFGFVLLMPTHTFDNRAYATMNSLASENVWALISLSIATTQFFSMVYKNKKMKIISLCLVSFFWSFIGSMFFINDIVTGTLNTAFGTYLCIAGFSLWLSYTVGGQRNE